MQLGHCKHCHGQLGELQKIGRDPKTGDPIRPFKFRWVVACVVCQTEVLDHPFQAELDAAEVKRQEEAARIAAMPPMPHTMHMADSFDLTLRRLEALEKRVASLETENAMLKQQAAVADRKSKRAG